MDRQAWVVISLCVLGLIGWYAYTATHLPPPAPARPQPTPGLTTDNTPGATSTPSVSASAAPVATASPSPAETVAPFVEKTETLANGDLELHLTNRGGAIAEAVLVRHTVENKQRVVLNAPDRLPIGAILEQPDAALPEFTVGREGDSAVQFERKTPDSVTVRKRFVFPATTEKKDNYVVAMDVDFRNDGAQPYSNPGYFVSLGSSLPLHRNEVPLYPRFVWFVDGKRKDKNASSFSAQSYPLIGVERQAASTSFRETVNGAEWAAVSNQFFTTLLTPLDAKGLGIWGRPVDLEPNDQTMRGLEGALAMPAFQVQPGQSATHHFQIYLGPKLYDRLAKLQPDHQQSEIMDFGWFKLVSRFLLNFMNLIHNWVKDYGWSIIILTACVKGVLWPLQNKANKSMRRMSALAPKMQALKEKYKDDPTRMNQEVMKLYKEHGVNPVGGCLPMLIQIPVFFGLFGMLREAAELRNASFLWVKDLSMPDTLFTIPGMGWVPFIGSPAGLPINILPILMGATNIWLMRMTPKTGDATQRRVMMFMPLIFLFFCYNFAAALALYYTTQNLFTILQLYQNQKQPAPVLEKVAPPGKRDRKARR